ncbi:MAG: DUF4203 domain-containing protein [Candidatus Saccharibacteria bacterium]
MDVLFALLSAVVGLLLVFGGYRLARVIIPLWGFVAGLSLGGAVAADMAGSKFLGTLAGVSIGLVLGLVFAGLAYLFYRLAVVLLAGSLGYWVGSSFMLFLGLNRGLASMLVGLGIGVLVGLAALLVDAPRYVLIAYTSLAGALATVGGLLLLFNRIPLSAFDYRSAKVVIANSGLWTIVTLVLAIVGMVAQARTTKSYSFDEWRMSGDNSQHLPPSSSVSRPSGAH